MRNGFSNPSLIVTLLFPSIECFKMAKQARNLLLFSNTYWHHRWQYPVRPVVIQFIYFVMSMIWQRNLTPLPRPTKSRTVLKWHRDNSSSTYLKCPNWVSWFACHQLINITVWNSWFSVPSCDLDWLTVASYFCVTLFHKYRMLKIVTIQPTLCCQSDGG